MSIERPDACAVVSGNVVHMDGLECARSLSLDQLARSLDSCSLIELAFRAGSFPH